MSDPFKFCVGMALLVSGVFLLIFGSTGCITTQDLNEAKKTAREIARMACMSQPMLEQNLIAAHYTVTTTGAVERFIIVIDKKAPRRRTPAPVVAPILVPVPK